MNAKFSGLKKNPVLSKASIYFLNWTLPLPCLALGKNLQPFKVYATFTITNKTCLALKMASNYPQLLIPKPKITSPNTGLPSTNFQDLD